MRKTVAVILALLLIMLTLPLSTVHADLSHPDTLEIEAARCYRHMLAPNDVLIIAQYNCYYASNSTQPAQPIDKTFVFSYTDSEGNVTANATAYPFFNLGYARGLVAFYWEADDAYKPAWSDLGNITANGTALFDTPPMATLTLSSDDWVSSTQPSAQREDFRQWLLNELIFIELDWNNWAIDNGYTDPVISLTTTLAGDYYYASPQGQAYLTFTIEDITSIVPNLFTTSITQPTYTDKTFDLSQQTTYEDIHDTDQVGIAGAALGDLMGGVSRIWATTLVVLLGVGGILIVSALPQFGFKLNCGFIVAYAIILVATPEGLFHMGLMGVFAMLAVIQLAHHYFWSRSAG